MAHMTKDEARELARRYSIPLTRNFFSLDAETVRRIAEAAESRRYHKPVVAPDSLESCFFRFLKLTVLGDPSPDWIHPALRNR